MFSNCELMWCLVLYIYIYMRHEHRTLSSVNIVMYDPL